jgi:predicted thioesterase
MVEPGISLERKRIVSDEDAITFLGDGVKPSLSTPRMIMWMEYAARDAVLPHLEPGQDTVGVRVDVSHLAATPLGEEVTYRATISKVEGRRLTFEVEALDSRETVGKGLHERYIVDVKRFAEGLRKRFGQA